MSAPVFPNGAWQGKSMDQGPESPPPWLPSPDRLYFRVGEVAKIAGVETHVLRFWETQFPSLSPRKLPGGHRRYSREDVEMVLSIKHLLREDGRTIAGARKVLGKTLRDAESSEAAAPRQGEQLMLFHHVPSESLRTIKAELREILALLEP